MAAAAADSVSTYNDYGKNDKLKAIACNAIVLN